MKSKLNVEKVVKPPNIPVIMNNFNIVLSLNILTSILVKKVIKKEPIILIIEVVQIMVNGKIYLGELLYKKTSLVANIEHMYLSIPPIADPAPTVKMDKNVFMM